MMGGRREKRKYGEGRKKKGQRTKIKVKGKG